MKNVIFLVAGPPFILNTFKLIKEKPKKDWEKRYNTKTNQRNKHYAKNRRK